MGQESAPLADRLASYIGQKWKLPAEQARGRANRLLEQVGLDLGEALDDFLQAAKPANTNEAAQRESEYWSKAAYWESIDSEAATMLQAVAATPEEMKAAVRRQKS